MRPCPTMDARTHRASAEKPRGGRIRLVAGRSCSSSPGWPGTGLGVFRARTPGCAIAWGCCSPVGPPGPASRTGQGLTGLGLWPGSPAAGRSAPARCADSSGGPPRCWPAHSPDHPEVPGKGSEGSNHARQTRPAGSQVGGSKLPQAFPPIPAAQLGEQHPPRPLHPPRQGPHRPAVIAGRVQVIGQPGQPSAYRPPPDAQLIGYVRRALGGQPQEDAQLAQQLARLPPVCRPSTHRPDPGAAAATIATIPARIAAGRLGQASATRANSGSTGLSAGAAWGPSLHPTGGSTGGACSESAELLGFSAMSDGFENR